MTSFTLLFYNAVAMIYYSIYYIVTIANYTFPKGVLLRKKMPLFSTPIIRNTCKECE